MSQTLKLKKLSFLVYGLGATGYSVIKYLKKKNYNFYVWDDNVRLRKKFKSFDTDFDQIRTRYGSGYSWRE